MPSVLETRPGRWRCKVRLPGHKERSKTFGSEADAWKWGHDQEAELRAPPARGVAAPAVVGARVTVGQLINAFRKLRGRGGKPIDRRSNEHYMVAHLERDLARERVADLTPQRLSQWASARAEEGAGPSTVQGELSKLGTIFKYGAIELHTALPDVITPAKPLLAYQGLIGHSWHRDRRVDDAELARVKKHLSIEMRDIVDFAIASTFRRGEILRVRWADLDAARRVLLVRDRKHPRKTKGNHQRVPLTEVGLSIIERQPRVDERIFAGFTGENVSDAFLAACRAAGVADLHFHDLRHEAISRLFEAGYEIQEVALFSGHQDWRHLKRYTHLRPESLVSSGARRLELAS